jgi:hypothetical protein
MGKRKYSITDLQKHASDSGGQCLSAEYAGADENYSWECASNHTWSARWMHVKNGSWCPHCSGRTRGSIDYMNKLASSQGGRCLSTEYKNAHTHLLWECVEGHQWEAKPNNIQQGKWCPICRQRDASRKQLIPISELQSYAASRGGALLTESYGHSSDKLCWRCDKGHEWEASTRSVYGQKSWCPTCGIETIRRKQLDPGGFARLQSLAHDRGGELLSSEYKGVSKQHHWRCANGHSWKARPSDIIRGGWCPNCKQGLGERITRAFFEQIFDREFVRLRPDWLVSQSGNRLELDGYCEELKLAFEHQGAQHFRWLQSFHQSEDDFKAQIARDEEKRTICRKLGIALIEIPEVPQLTSVPDLKNLIIAECDRANVVLPSDAKTKDIDLGPTYSLGPHQRLVDVASERGGELLSDNFKGYHRRHSWKCDAGHTWDATPSSIIYGGSWCPYCAGTMKHTIERAREIAAERGGCCDSEEYENARSKLIWRCEHGHEWHASLDSVSRGSWCPSCAGVKRLTIIGMREVARQRGGECLSLEYKNMSIKLKWRCQVGHEWEALPGNVIHKESWCPKCWSIRRGKR